MSDADGQQVDDRASEGRGRQYKVWMALFVVSLGLLIAVTSFGAGMLAERVLFAGGSVFERAREIGGLSSDTGGDREDGFPLVGEVREVIEDEYLLRPASPEALEDFRATLERDAVAGMATAAAAAAATPVASVEEYLRGLEYGAVRGMADGLPDDYSAFLAPPEQAPLAEQLSGEYEGIGVYIEQPGGALTVVSAIPGSPAEEAGLRAGDALERADGHPLQGLSNQDALRLIRGPAGTEVRLTVRRPGQAAPFEVGVERRAVALPSVAYHPVAGGRVAWIGLSIFGDKTTAELDEALRRAREEKVAGIVLDLRRNTGGWVVGAREVIGRFVPEDRGPALYEDENAGDDGELREESIIGNGEKAYEVPLAVLVDELTASAAEIVAGALADYDRAPLVGTRTFGKGLVQQVHDFDDGSSLRITSARWLTPAKQPIPEDGLEPDVPVAAGPAGGPEDVQLDRAVELVLGG